MLSSYFLNIDPFNFIRLNTNIARYSKFIPEQNITVYTVKLSPKIQLWTNRYINVYNRYLLNIRFSLSIYV